MRPSPRATTTDLMGARLRYRATAQAGFTLTELLIVMVVIAILIAIAIPSYLGYRDRSIRATASSNLRQALPATEVYYNEYGSYMGMTRASLLALNIGLSPNLQVASANANAYCLADSVGGQTWSLPGPGGSASDVVQNGSCS